MAFLNSNLHTRLAIVTKNELGLAFPSKEPSQKISSRSVHVLFSYRGNKQTDRQTNAGKNIIPRFRGDKNGTYFVDKMYKRVCQKRKQRVTYAGFYAETCQSKGGSGQRSQQGNNQRQRAAAKKAG